MSHSLTVCNSSLNQRLSLRRKPGGSRREGEREGGRGGEREGGGGGGRREGKMKGGK